MSLHTKQNRAVKPKEVAAIKKELARLEAMEKSLKLREQAVVARERAVGMAPDDSRRSSASAASGGATLSEQLRQAKFTIGLLEKRLKELEATHKADLQAQLESASLGLARKLKQKSEELKLSEAAGATARKEVGDLKHQLAALTNDLKAARSANRGAAQAQEQLATSRGRIAELEARVRDMSSMQDTQRSALEAAYAKAEEMDKLHQAQARKFKALQEAAVREAKYTEEVAAELDRTKRELAALNSTTSSQQKSAQELHKQLQALTKERDAAQKAKARQSAEFAASLSELEARHSALVDQLRRKIDDSQSARTAAEEQASALESELASKQRSLETKERECESAQASAKEAAERHEQEAERWAAERSAFEKAKKEWADREATLVARIRAAAQAASADTELAALQRKLRELQQQADAAQATSASEIKMLQERLSLLQLKLGEQDSEHLKAMERMKRKLRDALEDGHAREERQDKQLGELRAKLRQAETQNQRHLETIERLKQQLAMKETMLSKVTAKLASLIASGEHYVQDRTEWERDMQKLKRQAEDIRQRYVSDGEHGKPPRGRNRASAASRASLASDPGGENQSRLPMLGAAAGGGPGPRRARKSIPESSKPESHSRVVGVVPKPPRSFRSPFAGSDSAGSGGGALHPAPPGGSRAAGPQASSRYYAMLGGGANSGSNSAGSLHSGHGGGSYDTPGADRRSRAHSSMSSPAARRDGDGSPGQRHRIVITPVT